MSIKYESPEDFTEAETWKGIIQEDCERFFKIINKHGNTKDGIEQGFQMLMAEQIDVMRKCLPHLDSGDVHIINATHFLLIVIFETLMANPLWDTDALQAQLREQMKEVLRHPVAAYTSEE